MAGATQVRSPRDPAEYAAVVDTTPQSPEAWSRALSPFSLGPVSIWPGNVWRSSANVENAWQFSKVYADQLDPPASPGAAPLPGLAHARWAREGWADPRAQRYPRGRGARPLYFLHRGRRLDPVAARLYLYVPLYLEGLCVSPEARGAYARLFAEHAAAGRAGAPLTLLDHDGYDPLAGGEGPDDGAETFAAVLLNPRKKAGHAFILAALLDGTFTEGYRRALARSPGARALEAAGVSPPALPDFTPLRAEELHAGLARLGAEVHFRPGCLGLLADSFLAALLPGGGGRVPWARGRVNVHGWKDERRQTAFYGDAGVVYRYSGRQLRATPWSADPSGVLLSARALVARAVGAEATSCLLNLYDGPGEVVGKHSDDETGLEPGAAIATLSLGGRRRFGLEDKAEKERAQVFSLGAGALLVMAGRTQELCRHWLYAGSARAGDESAPRISLTFRRTLASEGP